MKRVYIAWAVLAICLAFCIFSYFTIKNDCEMLCEKAQIVSQYSKNNDLEKVNSENEEIKKLWNKYSMPFSLLTTHTHFDSLEAAIDSLSRAVDKQDKEETEDACRKLIFEAKHIITSISPKAENVF